MNRNENITWVDFAYVGDGRVQPLQEVWFQDPETIRKSGSIKAAEIQAGHIKEHGRGPFVVFGIVRFALNDGCFILFTCKDGKEFALLEDWFTR